MQFIIGVKAAKKFAVFSISYQKLLALSPHSLRHLNASHKSHAGIHLQMIKENLRHSSIKTTHIDMHAEN